MHIVKIPSVGRVLATRRTEVDAGFGPLGGSSSQGGSQGHQDSGQLSIILAEIARDESRMKSMSAKPPPTFSPCQLAGKENVGEFGAAVYAEDAIISFGLEVVEIDRATEFMCTGSR